MKTILLMFGMIPLMFEMTVRLYAQAPSTEQTITPPANTNFTINTSGTGGLVLNQKGTSPLWTGSHLFPNIAPPISTTATSTSGSNIFKVANSAEIQVGMSINTSFVTYCVLPTGAFTIPYVTAVSGGSITMTCPAQVTNSSPVAVTFGATRTDPNSAAIVNSLATKWLLVGGATLGNSDAIQGGLSDPNNMNAQIQGYGNSLGLLVSSRTSDMTGGSGTRPMNIGVVADTLRAGENANVWAEYIQSNLMHGTNGTGQHLQIEQSINNNWNPVSTITDPYLINELNNTVSVRIDCGTGQPVSTPGVSPNNCTTGVDIVPNGAGFENGILIGNGALDTSRGRIAPALEMPSNTGLKWYTSPGNVQGEIYTDGSGNLNIPLGLVKITHLGNGVGLQTARNTTTTCAPANTAFAACTFTVTFPLAEPDANYGYSCSIDAVHALMGSVHNRTTTGLMIDVYGTGTGTATVSGASCIITHQ